MNKKMLLVVLMPFALNAHVAELLNDINIKFKVLRNLATAPFGKEHPELNRVASAVHHEVAQTVVKNYVSAIDAKFLGKTLVDTKGVKVATGDILCFAAAVAVSTANDRLKGNHNSHAQNAASHAATRLVVAGLDKAYDAVAPKVASLIGVENVSIDAAVSEVLPEVVAVTVNSVRATLVRAAVYGVVRNSVERVTTGFFAKP